MAKSITKTVISKATCLSSPNASIGDMVSIKTGFPIKHFGNDNKGEYRLTYALITSIPSVDEIREGVAPLYRDKVTLSIRRRSKRTPRKKRLHESSIFSDPREQKR